MNGRCLFRVLISVVMLCPIVAMAQPPPDRIEVLRRGVNITGWFRFPGSADPNALRNWMSDAAISDLRTAGFSFVRLAVQPQFLSGAEQRQALLIEAIRRIQRYGLAVVVDAHPAAWHLEEEPADRLSLKRFWQHLAPVLRSLPPQLTFPELLNEPVFAGAPDRWHALQHEVLTEVRTILPEHTMVLTGNDWGSIAGLLALAPEQDLNVVYSVHFYEPAELTSLAAYRPELDRDAIAELPFPAEDREACDRIADHSTGPTGGLMHYYCALSWGQSRIRQRFGAAADWAARNHAHLLLGEFGASETLNSSARLAWLQTVQMAAEARGIGWALWGWDDVMGFGVSRPPGARPRLDGDILRVLGLTPQK